MSAGDFLGIRDKKLQNLKEMDEMSGLWVYNEQKIAKGAKNGASYITIIHSPKIRSFWDIYLVT